MIWNRTDRSSAKSWMCHPSSIPRLHLQMKKTMYIYVLYNIILHCITLYNIMCYNCAITVYGCTSAIVDGVWHWGRPSRPSGGVDQMRQAVTSLFQGREIADFVAAPSDLWWVGCLSCHVFHMSPRFPKLQLKPTAPRNNFKWTKDDENDESLGFDRYN